MDRQRRDLRQRGPAARAVGAAVHRRRHRSVRFGRSPGSLQGQTVAINETVTSQLPLCTVTSQTVTLANGTPVNAAPAVQRHPRGRGEHVHDHQRRDLHVQPPARQDGGGRARPARRRGPSRRSHRAGRWPDRPARPVSPPTSRPASSTRSPSRAGTRTTSRTTSGRAPVPGSTGSWRCVEVDANGAEIPGFCDGINGGVTVPLGQRVRCTATNRTVDPRPAQGREQQLRRNRRCQPHWTLTATPTGTPPAGVVAQSVPGSVAGTELSVRPGQEYAPHGVGGPSGYELVSIECEIGESPPLPTTTSS